MEKIIFGAANNLNYKTKQSKIDSGDKINYKYPIAQGIGVAAGYCIPIKPIDGPDVVSGTKGGLLMKGKTKTPNIPGKWRNALIGTFIGTIAVEVYDMFKKKNLQS